MKKIKKIAITGGTHGNELTGIYLINKFFKNPILVKRDSFETFLMLTNVKAIKQGTRYVQKDLNRTFALKELENKSLKSYEDILAKKINKELGPKGSENPNIDFIMDLHSTTANMGLSLGVNLKDKLSLQVATYVKEHIPELKIYSWRGELKDASFVSSISPSGFTIEVGSISQGILRADIFFKTEKLIQTILDFFELYNTNSLKKTCSQIDIYCNAKIIDFPKDKNGNIEAMVHPNLQENGYLKLKKGDSLFVSLNGENIYYEDTTEVYPIFVNEAAYYEKGIAMFFTEKKTIKI